jgi:hypothetical protein
MAASYPPAQQLIANLTALAAPAVTPRMSRYETSGPRPAAEPISDILTRINEEAVIRAIGRTGRLVI